MLKNLLLSFLNNFIFDWIVMCLFVWHQLLDGMHPAIVNRSHLRSWLLGQVVADMIWWCITYGYLGHERSSAPATAADWVARRAPFHWRRCCPDRCPIVFSITVWLMIETAIAHVLYRFVFIIGGCWPRRMITHIDGARWALWVVVLVTSTVNSIDWFCVRLVYRLHCVLFNFYVINLFECDFFYDWKFRIIYNVSIFGLCMCAW